MPRQRHALQNSKHRNVLCGDDCSGMRLSLCTLWNKTGVWKRSFTYSLSHRCLFQLADSIRKQIDGAFTEFIDLSEVRDFLQYDVARKGLQALVTHPPIMFPVSGVSQRFTFRVSLPPLLPTDTYDGHHPRRSPIAHEKNELGGRY